MTSLAKMLSVLDLFSAENPQHTAEQVCEALGFSRPTGYRYVKELVDTGLLQRISNGRYALGHRIIILDYNIRMADPVLKAGIPLMKDLVAQTGCDCVISALYGTHVLDIHRESGSESLALAYGRGRPRPLFLGAAPKAILSAHPRARLKKLYEAAAREAAAAGLGGSWDEFRAAMTRIRKAGYYVSSGELEPNISAIAAPLLTPDQEVVGAISLVTSTQRLGLLDQAQLIDLLQRAAGYIGAQIGFNPGTESHAAASHSRPAKTSRKPKPPK